MAPGEREGRGGGWRYYIHVMYIYAYDA
jgi:hypothetical protein